jgi:hypothetical protein
MLKPEKIMGEFGRRYPGCWKQLEGFALSRGQGNLPDWPGWCYMPVAGIIRKWVADFTGIRIKNKSAGKILDAPQNEIESLYEDMAGVMESDPGHIFVVSLWGQENFPDLSFRFCPWQFVFCFLCQQKNKTTSKIANSKCLQRKGVYFPLPFPFPV